MYAWPLVLNCWVLQNIYALRVCCYQEHTEDILRFQVFLVSKMANEELSCLAVFETTFPVLLLMYFYLQKKKVNLLYPIFNGYVPLGPKRDSVSL